MRSFVLLISLALPAYAQDGIRTSDTILTAQQLSETLGGQVAEFFDGSKSKFGSDGRYAYTYTDDGPPWTGDHSFQDNGQVCVAFDNGSERCDTIVLKGERLVLIIEDGTRFPVRNLSVYQN